MSPAASNAHILESLRIVEEPGQFHIDLGNCRAVEERIDHHKPKSLQVG